MAQTAAALADIAIARSKIDQLFSHFDMDDNGYLGFPEVAALFKQLAPEKSTHSACNAAVEALLMVDSNADSCLDKAEFEQLLIKVSGISGVPLLEAANKLLDIIQQPTATTDGSIHEAAAAAEVEAATSGTRAGNLDTLLCSAAQVAAGFPAEGVSAALTPAAAAAPSGVEAAKAALSASGSAVEHSTKVLALFEHWDTNGDGRVSFGELCQGLAKFKRLSCKKDVASLLRESSSVLAVHDTDSDRQLDINEFSAFMSVYMAAAGYQLADVLDELILIAATKPDDSKLQQLLDNAQPQIECALSGKR